MVATDLIGLTELYNCADDGAYTDLAKIHATLDETVAAAYGWPTKTAQNDAVLVERLGELNRRCAQEPSTYQPF